MGKNFSEGKPYKVIAYVLACFSNDEQMRIIKKVAKSSKEYNCKIVFFSTSTDFYYNDLIDAGEKKIFEMVQVDKYDAIVLMSESFKQDEEQLDLVKRANAAGVPIFAVDKCFDGCINLAFDYGDSFREIVKHMVEFHGYRTINFIAGMPDNTYSEERLNIYKEVLAENNIPYDPRRTYYGHFWEDPTIVALDKMFADGLSMPEAIICANDAMALATMKYLRKKGYRVPEDVALSGFDAIELEKYSNPRLTTGVYNVDDMIRYLFEMIVEGNWEEYRKKVTPIHNRMQIGQSCRCHGLEACNVADEMRRMKSEIHLLMKYHGEVNQMVANYGNEEDLSKVVTSVGQYTSLLAYQDLWICFEGLLMDYMSISNKERWMNQELNLDEKVGVLHYKSENGQGQFKEMLKGNPEELIPDMDGFFEEHDYCMVTVLHLNCTRVGYAVISMDVDSFNFMAYEPFLTNVRHLLELQQSQRKVIRIYERDQLTDLYNRNGFYKEIQNLMNCRDEEKLTIINMDMDGLKYVNDTFGHAEGDEALRNLGRIIRQSITDELAARIGGDEFLIAFSGRDNEARAEKIKNLIIRGLEAYNQNSTKEYVLQASVGIFTDSVGDHSLDYFLKKADEKMYVIKSQHKRETGDLK